MYALWKFVHVFGVVLLLGNAIITALWKARADRSRDPKVIAHAARTTIVADRVFTWPGVVLVAAGGYAMAARRPWPLHGLPWLDWGQGLFYLAVLLWIVVLVPAQRRLAALADAGSLTDDYALVSRRWAMWGGIVTLLLVIVLFLMVTKA